jgi:hypothetical protein
MARPNLGRHMDPEPTALVITDPQLEANKVRGQGLATVRPASSPLTHGFPNDSSRHIRCGCNILISFRAEPGTNQPPAHQ